MGVICFQGGIVLNPPAWQNGNLGGWEAALPAGGDTVQLVAYAGKRSLVAGGALLFNFSAMATPTKGNYLHTETAKREHVSSQRRFAAFRCLSTVRHHRCLCSLKPWWCECSTISSDTTISLTASGSRTLQRTCIATLVRDETLSICLWLCSGSAGLIEQGWPANSSERDCPQGPQRSSCTSPTG